MELQGSCHCGKVKFKVKSNTPVPYMRCYCSICRKLDGGGGYSINIMGLNDTLEVDGMENVKTYYCEKIIINVETRGITETKEDAARIARNLVNETGYGTLVTIMSENEDHMKGYPIGLLEYLSDDCPSTGDPLLLLSHVQLNVRNAFDDGLRASLSIRKLSSKKSFFPFAEPRLNLFGKITRVNESEENDVKNCYLEKHPKARYWLPGKVHSFHFYRFKVQDIYFIGGFIEEKLYHETTLDGGSDDISTIATTKTKMDLISQHDDEESSNENLILHLTTEFKKPFTGWDFSYLKGRMEENSGSLGWNYENTVRSLLPHHKGLLDMGTGSGEFLASLSPLPPDTCATEGWAPNIDIARKRLKPLGVTVTAITDYDVRLPINDARFDLIINRHEPYIIYEVHRLLKQNGIFVTQQVGERDNIEINKLLGAPEHLGYREWHLEQACSEMVKAGFTILEKQEAFIETKFYDVGAIVYYLRAIPWQIEDFSVEKYSEQLINLHHKIQNEGLFILQNHPKKYLYAHI
ncbi:18240_t:CDS:10 [Entrophospora sp. SA101]|nr:16407_t:CDS:10 [Entrophospora sp. SA101]CAJ0758337.1 18240_t:CDS:10 [Entrophospora sp. SA101]